MRILGIRNWELGTRTLRLLAALALAKEALRPARPKRRQARTFISTLSHYVYHSLF